LQIAHGFLLRLRVYSVLTIEVGSRRAGRSE
jgi:hypothetical protein